MVLKKWLKEPLLHFLLIGAALFFFYAYQNDGYVDYDKRIVISKADINRLQTLWEKKWQRPPVDSELQGLLEQQIKEEVMYREALAMGLDLNDSVVRRRLAQKLEFISSDLVDQIEPTDAELAEFLARNPEKFEIPGRISFVQIYINADRHGENTEKYTLELLQQLQRPGSAVDIQNAGDPSMLGQQHTQLSHHGVARVFGTEFADFLFELPAGSWQGPVRSGYGLHLVWIETKTAAIQPELTAVRDDVKNEWQLEQRRSFNEALYKTLRQRYDIVIEGID
jgi:hypothetical protein